MEEQRPSSSLKPKLFSHKPQKGQAHLSSQGNTDSKKPAGPIQVRRPILDRIRGSFGFLLGLNLLLGGSDLVRAFVLQCFSMCGESAIRLACLLMIPGYMLFNGRNLRSRDDDIEEAIATAKKQLSSKNNKNQDQNHPKSDGEELREKGKEKEEMGESSNGQEEPGGAQKGEGSRTIAEATGQEKGETLEPAWELEHKMNPPYPGRSISYQDQMAILQWILEEKRKVKTKTWTEKWKIDSEKKMIKDLLRSGTQLPLKGI